LKVIKAVILNPGALSCRRRRGGMPHDLGEDFEDTTQSELARFNVEKSPLPDYEGLPTS
jgi:hypothetical protein